MKDLETVIHTDEKSTISVDTWDEGVWLHLIFRRGTASAILTREEAQALVAGLQAILAAEVEA